MKDVLTYKGFIGSVHFSAEDKVFHGKVKGIDDLVTFEGSTVEELIKAFHEEVDDYIKLCKEQSKEPLRSYKGSFNVRISPELHKKAVERARTLGITLNKLIQMAVEKETIGKD
ncbi:MAG: type II toxin-antitoxin system HicB family antitoxin [Candidatus Jettenia sp.]|uniref:HicB n=1 Tax=Candidatus Jettenia caeni TaxID=247490 RepID=I3IGE4_9BACT|nr:type II toxin-antitoxin system HicB family antitoxin [Candidatus Jettenia sp. AMX1]MBC6929393.1 type II toxin-antitoxin system HicB family antitoxin [Candidatus Jettenia sp.]NUN23981.1 type II toxin-antitoxin system HicB family antitoxin [Candidatus Jettenia caeni]KAA0249136.1 MAG: type II toxin-antitoxin system HicB family antitoxin [Candidatus Jettenia sp. AMX1]MCE7881901.1 type II toxin-antitoxin system HicB family antitoxin [Candidatus Jettenia sp. AMX1]MCQ3927051.1 type II toxin-antito